MKDELDNSQIINLIAENDENNLAVIARAEQQRNINSEAREYLETLYSGGMQKFSQIFYVLGRCFGAPKAAVTPYNYVTGAVIDSPMKISDINPLSAYMVHHRLDADPMRNQFFAKIDGHRVELSVSSIVSVIVGAQKNVNRSLEKITKKYYKEYIDEVASVTESVIAKTGRVSSGQAIAEKVRQKFSEKFITNASETVLSIIGSGHEKISVELVRELDKIIKPHMRLQDVWRVKCLFDLIPQARTFIEKIREILPDKIINVRDTFYDVSNPRNYRDAKVMLNIGSNGNVIPMEIICQVRTLFDFERRDHEYYELSRSSNSKKEELEKSMAEFKENGIKEYNLMICDCLDDLFDRVGWNILYNQGAGESLFEGFPKIARQYYPDKIVETILNKLDSAVENEVFYVTTAPAKLNKSQEMEIFRWMARFVLVSAMPYTNGDWAVSSDNMPGKLFNFVMKELYRYIRK